MQPRERRTVALGGITVTVLLLVSMVLVPFARRWQLREVELRTTRDSIRELRGLVRSAHALDSVSRAADATLSSEGRRVFRARSATLGASALQSFLQDAADASRLVVTRLEVAPSLEPGATYVPATIAAYSDIHGVAELLGHLEHGPRVVNVERMTVQMNSALRGAPDVLQVTLTLRAPVIIE